MGSEWAPQGDHLEDENSDAPDIRLEAVRMAINDFRRHVVGSPTHGFCGIDGAVQRLGNAEVAQQQVIGTTNLVEEGVWRFDVTMDDVAAVASTNAADELRAERH